jgi:hypothetical protein
MTPRPAVYTEKRHERGKSGSKWPFWGPIRAVGHREMFRSRHMRMPLQIFLPKSFGYFVKTSPRLSYQICVTRILYM